MKNPCARWWRAPIAMDGHATVTAGDGRRSAGDPEPRAGPAFDLLLTDIQMPVDGRYRALALTART